mgnify:CR=1 FL=1
MAMRTMQRSASGRMVPSLLTNLVPSTVAPMPTPAPVVPNCARAVRSTRILQLDIVGVVTSRRVGVTSHNLGLHIHYAACTYARVQRQGVRLGVDTAGVCVVVTDSGDMLHTSDNSRPSGFIKAS